MAYKISNQVWVKTCVVCNRAHIAWRKLREPMCEQCIKAEQKAALDRDGA